MNSTQVTIKAEEVMWITKNVLVPNIKTNKVVKSLFHSCEVVQPEFASEGTPIPKPLLFKASWIVANMMLRN